MAKTRSAFAKSKVLRALKKEIGRLGRQHTLLKQTSPEIFEKTLATLESAEGAALWLSHRQFFARNKTPAELAQTALGREAVVNQLMRIEYGVYL